MSNKTRLDVLLTERGLLDSRQKAQATIMSGIVFVDGKRVETPPKEMELLYRGQWFPTIPISKFAAQR